MQKSTVMGLAMILLALLIGCARPHPVATITHGPAISADMDRAVDIAASAAQQKGQPLAEYTLTSAQRIFHNGKYLWRITFKSSKLLPRDPSKEAIGMGGEIFVNVDLGTQEAEVRYGE